MRKLTLGEQWKVIVVKDKIWIKEEQQKNCGERERSKIRGENMFTIIVTLFIFK